jgi:ribosomal protein S18 acetylase RimI-like enzyme
MATEFDFRRISPADAEAVHELGASCIELDVGIKGSTFYTPDKIGTWAESEYDASYVAKDGEKLAGFILGQVLPGSGDAQINAVAVSPSYRGKGIATQLTRLSLSRFNEFPVDTVRIIVNTMDNAMLHLLEKADVSVSQEVFRYAELDLRAKKPSR